MRVLQAYLHSPHDSLSSKIQTLQLTTSQPTNRLSTKRRTGKKIAGKLPTTSSLHFPSEPTHLTKHRTVVRNKSREKSRHQFFFHINYWHIAHEKNLSPSLFLLIDTFSIRMISAKNTAKRSNYIQQTLSNILLATGFSGYRIESDKKKIALHVFSKYNTGNCTYY